ncbi:MAG: hypothetical protein HC819_24970 [Cyclobacteriaceae bacterium]|nr:hypothetical protein [Cyclobacteriaceae bacterium]
MQYNNFNSGHAPWDIPDYNYTPSPPETKRVKKTTKTVEKYDENNNYLGKEIETIEEEVYDKTVWGTSEYVCRESINTISHDDSISGTKNRIDSNVPFTLTNGMQVQSCVADY